MVAIARERVPTTDHPERLKFILGDILEEPSGELFDLIWSRDALMHLPNKPRLFSRLYDLTKPGGSLVITDYAKSASPTSYAFDTYVKETGYHLTDPMSYGRLLEEAGFVDVVVEDATTRFIDILQREAARLAEHREDFLQSFTERDLTYLIDRWAMKVRFCRAGDMKWGIYSARKAA
jgi:phosphoethanolamine N-methyltransferase